MSFTQQWQTCLVYFKTTKLQTVFCIKKDCKSKYVHFKFGSWRL